MNNWLDKKWYENKNLQKFGLKKETEISSSFVSQRFSKEEITQFSPYK